MQYTQICLNLDSGENINNIGRSINADAIMMPAEDDISAYVPFPEMLTGNRIRAGEKPVAKNTVNTVNTVNAVNAVNNDWTAYSGYNTGVTASNPGSSAQNSEHSHNIPLNPFECIAYVDGSFNPYSFIYGCGAVLLLPGGTVKHIKGHGSNAELASMRNIAGEILGSMKAIREAYMLGMKAIKIHYDYTGIEKWANNQWQANKGGTIMYKEYVAKARRYINIEFVKVKAHAGVYYNELADRLAKEAAGVPI